MKRLLFVLFAAALYQPMAFAVLGQHESNISTNEKVKLIAKSHTNIQSSCYNTHNLELSGTTLIEYSVPSGQVFAASWRGIKTPDLSVVFGSYYDEYKAARENMNISKGQRVISVKSDNFIVSSGGQMRNMHGFGYIPALVPVCADINKLGGSK